MRPGVERHTSEGNTVQYDATIRLASRDGDCTDLDRVKITKRFGETLTVPLVYEIMSPLQQGSEWDALCFAQAGSMSDKSSIVIKSNVKNIQARL